MDAYRRRVAPLATKVLASTASGLTRAGGELGRLAADAERDFAKTDAAVVDPNRTYTVAASEMLLPHGRPVGTEVEAVASYLER